MKEDEVWFPLGDKTSICKPDEDHPEEEVEEHRVEVDASCCPTAQLQNLDRISYLASQSFSLRMLLLNLGH